MAHAWTQVRGAMVSLLEVNKVSYSRAYPTRIAPARDVKSYLLVYVTSESVQQLSATPDPVQLRSMSITIAARVPLPNESEVVEDRLESMVSEIEGKLTFTALNTALSGKLGHLEYTGSNIDLTTDENERSYAEAQMAWRVDVLTQQSDPETLLN